MKLISWNVNGLRACITKGFYDFVSVQQPDIIALQETKMQPEQFDGGIEGYDIFWNSAEKKGYSGTAVFVKHQPMSIAIGGTAYWKFEARAAGRRESVIAQVP